MSKIKLSDISDKKYSEIDGFHPDKDLVDWKSDILVVPNFPLKNKSGKTARVDFLISYKDKKKMKPVFIECDSFQYHSTQQHLMQDKKRERALVETGIPILRFAGGEIHKNAIKVAREILEYGFD